MARLTPILILAICLTFSITSFTRAEQSTEAVKHVATQVTLLENEALPTPAEIPEPKTEDTNPALSVKADVITTAPASSGSEVSRGSSTARSVISCSLRFLGSPYRYGGKTIRGFDCSGFVGHVFGLMDIELPRSSREQAKAGSHVEKESLIPADLVFFKTGGSSRINHVGIYLGDNRFIHASTTRGIVITSLNDKYYKKAYYGARRVLDK